LVGSFFAGPYLSVAGNHIHGHPWREGGVAFLSLKNLVFCRYRNLKIYSWEQISHSSSSGRKIG
jgi:hypothetical protein